MRPKCEHGQPRSVLRSIRENSPTNYPVASLDECWCCGCWLGPDNRDGVCGTCSEDEQ